MLARLVAAIVWVIIFSAAAPPALAKKLAIGQAAPEMEMTGFDNAKFKLSDFRGQVIVLNYWATWCVPCREELPLLDGYYRLQKQHGMQVFAIATEDSVPPSQLKKLAAVVTLTMAKRARGPYDDSISAVPMNYVIDRAGVIRYAKSGAFTLDTLNKVIVPLLKEPAPGAEPAPPALTPTSAPAN